MTDITPFLFEGEHLVRMIEREGEPWFIAADVCACLELTNSRKAVASLDEDEKGVTLTHTLGGTQEMTIISEGGLYTLILRSRKATTPGTVQHRFRKWVTAEVLPSIRKTGRYEAPPAPEYPDTMPMEEARHWLRMIGEARMLFGKSAARDLWRRSPLPETGVDAASAGVAEDPGAALNGRQCLDHLLSWEPLAGRPPLGALLASGDAAACRRELARFGIDPAPRGMTGYFAVAYTRQCRPLVRRFAGTPWDGLWSAALQHVPGARRSRQSIWVGTTSSKAVMIPYGVIGGAAEPV